MQSQRTDVVRIGWGARIAIVIATALALGLVAALILLSVGIAVLLLPVIAVILAVGWWRWRKIEARLREEAARGGAEPEGRVIEIDYRVIDGDGPARS